MNETAINHTKKQFVTHDPETNICELDVKHQAAKLMVLTSQMQDAERDYDQATNIDSMPNTQNLFNSYISS